MAAREPTYNQTIDKGTRKLLREAKKRMGARSSTETLRRMAERHALLDDLEAQGFVLVATKTVARDTENYMATSTVLPPNTLAGRPAYLAHLQLLTATAKEPTT